ncbi:Ankyrin repeat, SAM and basic leucine zipper domain-containing protein 1 [Lonchura striata]|uniref:Ankyrin repeat, SAM and basic leucine zipper domain-containing protein 1 n=1 Tax=Lonchura striata TaxID=40157 RepID=A0A218V092_9PASE|nr:Ankyrin repeat, SAM and basic leucine zipper domain-containing protein 1 [Lonchura striata domestica]
MATVMCSFRVVAGGDEGSDSDDGDWDIGVVRQEPQQLDQMLQVDKHEALKKALFRGDVSLIEELLNSGISIETSFQFGWTPLMCAASVANFAVVRLLLDRGANACFEIDKYTVLMAACSAQASEENILNTVELLLSRNADPNLACRKQMTALMYAARKGYPRVVAFLVAHGSHINAQDENGYTVTSRLRVSKRLGGGTALGCSLKLTQGNSMPYNIMLSNKIGEWLGIGLLVGGVLPRVYSNSYSTFHDMEVFLHGLGLEHIRGLLQEQDIALRQLLTMQKDDLIQIGITNPGDQQKLLDAINDLQVEEKKFEDISEIMKLELSVEKLGEEVGKLKDLVVEVGMCE